MESPAPLLVCLTEHLSPPPSILNFLHFAPSPRISQPFLPTPFCLPLSSLSVPVFLHPSPAPPSLPLPLPRPTETPSLLILLGLHFSPEQGRSPPLIAPAQSPESGRGNCTAPARLWMTDPHIQSALIQMTDSYFKEPLDQIIVFIPSTSVCAAIPAVCV